MTLPAFRFHRPRRFIWQTDRAAVVGLFLALACCVLGTYQPAGFDSEPYVRLPFVSPGCVNLPEKEVIIISADADRRLYFAHSNRDMQTEVIRRVAARHGTRLTGQQLAELGQLPFLGLDYQYLPAYLALPAYERRQVRPLGISNDSGRNGLAEYIATGWAVTVEQAHTTPYLALRADSALDAQTIKQVIRTFQQQGIHRFYLLNQMY